MENRILLMILQVFGTNRLTNNLVLINNSINVLLILLCAFLFELLN